MTTTEEDIEYYFNKLSDQNEQLSEENKSTQKALSEIRNMLSEFIKSYRKKSEVYIERGYRP